VRICVRTLEGLGGYSGFSPYSLKCELHESALVKSGGSGFKGCDNHISFVDNC